jgi:ribosomal protein S24E
MEIELMEKKDHPLLSRIEVTFKVKHPNETTPKRYESNFWQIRDNRFC